MVAHPLAGVAGGWHEAGVGREPVGAPEPRDVAHGDEELGPEDRTHAGEAGEYPGLGALVEAPRQFPIQNAYAPLEVEHLPGELGDDGSGDGLRGQFNALAPGGGEGLLGEGVRLRDASLFQVGADAFAPRPADGACGLVAGHQLERARSVEVQRPLQGREEGEERLREAGDDPGLVGDQVPPAGEQQL